MHESVARARMLLHPLLLILLLQVPMLLLLMHLPMLLMLMHMPLLLLLLIVMSLLHLLLHLQSLGPRRPALQVVVLNRWRRSRRGQAMPKQLTLPTLCFAFHGPPPSPSHEVLHSCYNVGIMTDSCKCLSPLHLRWGSKADNAQDRGRKKSRKQHV